MNGRYLLDSNIVIEFLRGDQAVQARLAREPETFLNVVVLGELYFGARKSQHVDRNVERIEDFAGSVSILGSGSIATSPDGSSWTVRTSGTEKGLVSVAWTGRTFVAAGSGATVLLSSDGVAWRTVDPGVTADLNAVLWTGRGLVAAGTEGTLIASADGETWTDRTPAGFPIFSGVASSGSRFVAVGGGAEAWASGIASSSPDGLDWSRPSRAASPWDLAAVAWDGARFVSVGSSGAMFASPDGTGWSAEPFFTAANLQGVGLGGGRLLAVGEDGAVLERTGGRATKYWVPVATHSPGANGSAWRTDLGLLNPPSAAGGEAGIATAVVRGQQDERPGHRPAGRADVASGWASATVLSGGGLLVSSSVIDDRSNDPGRRTPWMP